MRKVFYTLGLTVVFNIASAAQKPASSADQTQNKAAASSKSAGTAKVSKASDGSASFSGVSNLKAQLQNTLDAKNAKVGDEVILKTTQSIKQNGQVVIPKGSELIGRVTEVQQRVKNGTASKLGLLFDQLKNGQAITPISASVVSIVNASASSAANQNGLDTDLSGSGSGSTRTSSGSSGGGGLLGGVTSTVGGLVNGTTQTVGGVTNTAGQAIGSTTSVVGQTVNGIQISTNASGSAQSSVTLSSQNKDVRLEKGVTFDLNIQKTGSN